MDSSKKRKLIDIIINAVVAAVSVLFGVTIG